MSSPPSSSRNRLLRPFLPTDSTSAPNAASRPTTNRFAHFVASLRNALPPVAAATLVRPGQGPFPVYPPAAEQALATDVSNLLFTGIDVGTYKTYKLNGEHVDVCFSASQVLDDALNKTWEIDDNYCLSLGSVTNNTEGLAYDALLIHLDTLLQGKKGYHLSGPFCFEHDYRFNLTLQSDQGQTTCYQLRLSRVIDVWRKHGVYFQAGSDPNTMQAVHQVILYHPPGNYVGQVWEPTDVLSGTFSSDRTTFNGEHICLAPKFYAPFPNQPALGQFNYCEWGTILVNLPDCALSKGTRKTNFFDQQGQFLGCLTEQGEFVPTGSGASCCWGSSALDVLSYYDDKPPSQAFQFGSDYASQNRLSNEPIFGTFMAVPDRPYPVQISTL